MWFFRIVLNQPSIHVNPKIFTYDGDGVKVMQVYTGGEMTLAIFKFKYIPRLRGCPVKPMEIIWSYRP
jgi:hypothetical protein